MFKVIITVLALSFSSVVLAQNTREEAPVFPDNSDFGYLVQECQDFVSTMEKPSKKKDKTLRSGICLGKLMGYLDTLTVDPAGNAISVTPEHKVVCVYNRAKLHAEVSYHTHTPQWSTLGQAIYLATQMSKLEAKEYGTEWQRGLTVFLAKTFTCTKEISL